MKIVLLSFSIFLFITGKAQNQLSGKIANAKGAAVAGASVAYLHHKVGSVCDANGIFSIQKIVGDTISVSAAGYKPVLIGIQEDMKAIDCTLKEDYRVLKEVVIAAKKKKLRQVDVGFYTTHDNVFSSMGTEQYNISVLIPNHLQIDTGYISKMKFRLYGYKNSNYSLQIQLLAMDTLTHLPNDSLVLVEKYLAFNQLKRVNTISLADEYLPFSPNGVFVRFKWLWAGNTDSVDLYNRSPYISITRTGDVSYTYFKDKTGRWVHKTSYSNPATDPYFYVPNLSLTISY